MKKLFRISFIIAVLLAVISYIMYYVVDFESNSLIKQSEFLYTIYTAFLEHGSIFNWLSYYLFPNLSKKSAFIIGEILFLPINFGQILVLLIIFKLSKEYLYKRFKKETVNNLIT